MELRDWAIRILSADTLAEKLFTPDALTDHDPGPPLVFKEPTRPPGMGFQRHTSREKLPAFHEHRHPDKRAACLHRFAGHELLAVEIMAHALIAFPNAPKHFRKGVANTLKRRAGACPPLYAEDGGDGPSSSATSPSTTIFGLTSPT